MSSFPPAERPEGFAARQCEAPVQTNPGTHHHSWRHERFSPLGLDPDRCLLAGSQMFGELRLCPQHARKAARQLASLSALSMGSISFPREHYSESCSGFCIDGASSTSRPLSEFLRIEGYAVDGCASSLHLIECFIGRGFVALDGWRELAFGNFQEPRVIALIRPQDRDLSTHFGKLLSVVDRKATVAGGGAATSRSSEGLAA